MAEVYNITLDQAATFKLHVDYGQPGGDPVDLTGYSARMQARSDYDSDEPIFDISEQTDPDQEGSITLGGEDGTIDVVMPPSATVELEPGKYVYDITVTSADGETTRLLEGRLVVNPCVTRET